jgi:2-C-methyl-D-erythritol 4-phosphate cytidylyltransferase
MIHAVIVAAGEGKRALGAIKKQFALLSSRPMIVHTLTPFFASSIIDTVSCVIAKDEISYFETLLQCYPEMKLDKIIEGGVSRQDSVAAGVFYLEKNYSSDDLVVIHDGARPFVTSKLIQKVIDAASPFCGAVAALPVNDSLKEVSAEGKILRSIPREGVWAMQTPQAFLLGVLAQALRKAQSESFIGTDEASIVERMGYPVLCVMGEEDNIKITTASDLLRAERGLAPPGNKVDPAVGVPTVGSPNCIDLFISSQEERLS